jgi:hypothetical protein
MGEYFAGKPKPKQLSRRGLDREKQERAWRLAARARGWRSDPAPAPRRCRESGERVMWVAYFYFMQHAPDRVRAAAPRHASYWQRIALANYQGGPFADRSGGLIVFNSESLELAERLVSGDPFLREGLLDQHWIREWLVDSHESGETAGQSRDRASDRVTARASAGD